MKLVKMTTRHVAFIVGCALAIALAACGQSKADKEAADVAAMRAMMEKEAADKKAAEEEDKQRMAKLKAQAASDAKSLGWSK